MKRNCLPLTTVVLIATGALAQEPPTASPVKEHEWLKQFTGQWTSTSKSVAQPGQPAMEGSGSMRSRMLGGFWIVNEMQGSMSGFTFQGLQTIGYDSAKGKYVGTWVDSVNDHLWRYEGRVDESGKKLMLVAEGPDFADAGKTAQYRDSYEFKTPDLIIATSEVQGADGKWLTFMTGEMKRAK